VSKQVDQKDVDAIVEIHEENAGAPDEAINKLVHQYLESEQRRYRRAKDGQKRPVLTVLDGGRVD
jgi:Asp-tRNA(Asn)/Glu-tRNA(Gln) amidotransferase B subunit